MPRLCLLTPGHLATCPRLVKAADSLAEAGYDVRTVSGNLTAWGAAADRDLLRRRPGKWRAEILDCARATALGRSAWTALVQRGARAAVGGHAPDRFPLALVARASLRAYRQLMRLAAREPADLFYIGGGAIALAALSAQGLRVALDLEDFHSRQSADPAGCRHDRLCGQLERHWLPRLCFRTAGSAAIADAYTRLYRLPTLAIHNTFPLPAQPPRIAALRRGEPLKLYWFSQTIGPDRGLQALLPAFREAAIPLELHLRGWCPEAFRQSFGALAADVPNLKLHWHPPAFPDEMVALASAYHIGLDPDPPALPRGLLPLTNKALTYPLAGLAMVVAMSPGRAALIRDLAAGALIFRAEAPGELAAGLRAWGENPESLARARQASWQAACQRWHWEHAADRGALLDAVRQVVGAPCV